LLAMLNVGRRSLSWFVGPLRMSALTVECPHCYGDVLPMADGRCPSCLADTRAAVGGCFTKVSLQHQAQGLPSVCMVCGMTTRRKMRFAQKARNERYVANPLQGGGGIGLLLTWLFDYVSGKTPGDFSGGAPMRRVSRTRTGSSREAFGLRSAHRDIYRASKLQAGA
jgi:hypothetical protein